MAIALVVVQPFGDYAKGDRITDPKKIEELRNDHAHRVVAIHVEDAPEPPPPPPAPAPTEDHAEPENH